MMLSVRPLLKWKGQFEEVFIASGDKDLMQLVDDKVKMVDTMKNIVYDAAKVREKMGVNPEQIVDYLAMVGDSSDNIPGMRGIGPKGATKLLQEHGNLEECIARKDSFRGKKLVTEAFSTFLEDARLSKRLLTIITDINLDFSIDELEYNSCRSSEFFTFLNELDFKSAIAKFEKLAEAEPLGQPAKKDSDGKFTTVSAGQFDKIIKFIDEAKILALEFLFDGPDLYKREVCGVGLSLDGKEGLYFPFDKGSLKSTHLDKLISHTYGNRAVGNLQC